MKQVLSGEDNMNAVILDTDYQKMWTGTVSISGPYVEIDIGAIGLSGQEVWVYCNNLTTGGGTSSKIMGGYSSIDSESGWYDQITGMVTCSDDLLECNEEQILCL